MQISANKVVSIHYTLKNDAGEVLDSSSGREPLSYLQGGGNIAIVYPEDGSSTVAELVSATSSARNVSPLSELRTKMSALIARPDALAV